MTKAIKKEEKKDLTKGAMPLVGGAPTVELGVYQKNEETEELELVTKEFKMRRLGISDTFKLMQIVAGGAAGLGAQLKTMDMSAEMVGMLLISGIPYQEKIAIELLASIIGVKPQDLANPDIFPMGTEIEIVQKLIDHQDMKAFMGKIGNMVKQPGMKSFLNKA